MSHTGRRYRDKSAISSVFPDDKPRKIPVTAEDIAIRKGAVLDGHQITGEFVGNGSTVLVGLSTSAILDIDNILNDDEKGVIIGYVPSSPYFHLFRNDGTGSKVTTVLDNRFKDDQYHVFDITIKSGKVFIRFDGAEDTITTKIPGIHDTLYIINYGVY